MLKMGGYGLLRVNVGMFPNEVANFAWALIPAGGNQRFVRGDSNDKADGLEAVDCQFQRQPHGVGTGRHWLGGSRRPAQVTGAGLNGAAMQLFTHGTITGLLFVGVGLIYDKAHTRYIPDLGGLASRMPIAAAALAIAGFASLGLPGLSGFVSEILVFFGAFRAFPLQTALSVLGIILAAGYILWMLERALFGPSRERFATITDASPLEAIPLVLLVASIVLVGIYPAFLTEVFDTAIAPMVDVINSTSALAATGADGAK